jgi:hypothetical protein
MMVTLVGPKVSTSQPFTKAVSDTSEPPVHPGSARKPLGGTGVSMLKRWGTHAKNIEKL